LLSAAPLERRTHFVLKTMRLVNNKWEPTMTFTAAITSVLTNYANFQGRAIRSEYWFWVLFYVLLSAATNVLELLVRHVFLIHGLFIIAFTLLYLFLLVPNLAVSVRRLHDLDKSGWWLLLVFIPLVGPIILLVWFCSPGTPGSNQFGGPMMGRSGPMPMPVGYN
jgi:uncharacterized membrane protein YhaH (DUF805 family)